MEEIRNEKGQYVKGIAQDTNKNGTAGRPTKMTEATLKKLEEAFAFGSTDEEACFYADISHQTLYNYQKENPDFVERKEALKQRPILQARRTVVNNLDKPEYAFKYLEKKRKDEFGNSASLEIRDRTEIDKHRESLKFLLDEAIKEADESNDTNTDSKDSDKEIREDS